MRRLGWLGLGVAVGMALWAGLSWIMLRRMVK